MSETYYLSSLDSVPFEPVRGWGELYRTAEDARAHEFDKRRR